MIKNKRTSYGLDKRFAQINEFEESGVFEIRMPLDFKLGKNEVKLKLLPNKLLKGSEVLIDIFDKNGNSIYYEISNIANEDESRSLIVFIYEDTVPGKCKIYLNAVLVNNKTYQCQITSDVITTVENTQEIKFSEEPKVKYTERTLQTQVFSTSTRQTSKNGTGDISIVSTISPKQTERDNLSIEKKEVRTVDQITSIANNIGSGSTFEIPTFFSPSTIISRNFPFSSSMEGGTIFVNGISLEVPSNALSSSPFLNQSFSASILKVIGTGAIEVYPPFRKTIEYQTSNGATLITFDRFFNHSNFTASYKELLTLQNSGYSQSYAVFDLSNIQPDSGVVDAVEVSYKSLNLIGSNYQPVGTFEVKSQNLLIDSASVFFKNPDGIVETPIGNFRSGLADFNTYWSTSSMGLTFPTASVSSKIVDGIKIDYGYRYSTSSFVIIEPKPQYKVNIAGANTQLNLSFDSFSENDLTDYIPQLDVYISGSEIITEPNQESIQLIPLASSSFGTYIGSISQTFGKVRKNSFTFVSKKSGNIVPKLISRVGKWHIGNIELKSIDEKGFNCNQTRIYAPMNLPTGSEVTFKIDYLNPVGRRTQTFSSIIEGVFFQGSTIRTGGSSVTIPNGTVSGSDQLTGSYDSRYETRGRNIFSSSAQIGPTGIYSGSGQVPRNTVISSNNIKFQSSTNDDGYVINQQYDVLVGELNSDSNVSGSLSISTGNADDNERVALNFQAFSSSAEIIFRNVSQSYSNKLRVSSELIAEYSSGSGDSTRFYLSSKEGTVFEDNRNVIKGIEYGGNYTASLINKDRSFSDVGLVKLIVSQSSNLFTSSYNNLYERKGTGIISSSNQIASEISGSINLYSGSTNSRLNSIEQTTGSLNQFSSSIQSQVNSIKLTTGSLNQFTGSANSRLSSLELTSGSLNSFTSSASNRLANLELTSGSVNLITGSMLNRLSSIELATGSLNNFSGSTNSRLGSLEIKTGSYASTGSNQFNGNQSISGSVNISTNLIVNKSTGSFSGSFHGQYSSSQQVDYNQITNKPVVSGSRLYGILISSGSASSSYSHQNLTYDTSQSKFQVTGSTNLNGNLFMTGSTSTRFSYTWDGPKTVGLTPGIVWTNMENATNIWLGTGPSLGQDAMYIGDFTEITQGRLFTAMGVAAAGPTSSLEVQYSLNGLTSWTPMITLAIGNTTGIKDSNWIRIPAGAQQFTYIRLVGYGGNGVADPRFSPPIALFR